jgi:5-methylcytosine-specific restriction endonuclease McrA
MHYNLYSASKMLVKGRKYNIPKGSKRQRTKIPVFGKNKNRFYYGDRDEYRNEYLDSQHWKDLRNEKLKVNPICENCGNLTMLDVHHVNYKNLYDVTVYDLKTLCRACHNNEHKILKKQKEVSSKPKKIRNKIKLKHNIKPSRIVGEIQYKLLCKFERDLIKNDKKQNLICA